MTTTASAASVSPSSTRVSRTERLTPDRLSAVSAQTAATAASRTCAGAQYDAKVSAIAAQLAVLPTTKAQPAR